MHLYLNYAKAHWMRAGENPPVGLILCSQKGTAEVHYALEGLFIKVLFVKHQTLLPTEAKIAKALEQITRRLANTVSTRKNIKEISVSNYCKMKIS